MPVVSPEYVANCNQNRTTYESRFSCVTLDSTPSMCCNKELMMHGPLLDEIPEALSPTPSGELVVPALPAGESLEFSLVVPTRNESHNLHELINLLKPAIASVAGNSYEIIIV